MRVHVHRYIAELSTLVLLDSSWLTKLITDLTMTVTALCIKLFHAKLQCTKGEENEMISGHLYDKNGDFTEWLSAMAEAYDKRAECFVEQFNNYPVASNKKLKVPALSIN